MAYRVKGRLEEVRARLVEALKEEGFGVLSEIPISEVLRARAGVEMEPYLVLGACNPQLARRALEADRRAGVLLPCNLVLRQVEEEVEVLLQNPLAFFPLLPDLPEGVAREALDRLQRAVGRLEG
ncbi:hypothetical protein THFILI_07145 [Thermus filiformis]|uniref:DUF302 domain-containing protein n=1 Tax=Thermus filiformis TaxID=276 RepID=A0A0D6XCI1_THEFI|nr:hypothetical protein THFILI_07145 [Thermus filiformis]